MQVKELTRRPLVSVAPDTPVREVARLMDQTVVGAVVVVEGHRPVGIVTDRDLVVRSMARDLPADARIDSVMTVDPVVLDAHAPPMPPWRCSSTTACVGCRWSRRTG